jgi:serine protease Do
MRKTMEIEKTMVRRRHFSWSLGFFGMTLVIGMGCVGVSGAIIGLESSQAWAGDRPGSASQRQGIGGEAEKGFEDIAKAVTPGVVNITATLDMYDTGGGRPPQPFGGFGGKQEPPQGSKRQRGSGSGVILSSDGYIVTNNHVVAGSRDLRVILPDSREFPAEVVGADPETDLAVIKIQAEGLPVIPWGNSSSLAVGQYVLAVGNPFGLNSTVTFGIVSALDRGMGLARFEEYIQTDAAINPGNSGGALVNTQGELVGINTAIASQSGGYQGVGFAVPTSQAKPVLEELMQKGRVVRGYLGLAAQELTPELAPWFGLQDRQGSLVTDVVTGGPADKAGIHRGDVIVRYQGQIVKEGRMLMEQVTRAPIGQQVELGIVKNGKERKVRAVIGEQPPVPQPPLPPVTRSEHPLAGVEVAEVAEPVIQEYGLNPSIKGAVVSFVEEGSAAELAGLMEGDVIVELNKHPTSSVSDYAVRYELLKREKAVLVVVVRASRHLYVVVTSS